MSYANRSSVRGGASTFRNKDISLQICDDRPYHFDEAPASRHGPTRPLFGHGHKWAFDGSDLHFARASSHPFALPVSPSNSAIPQPLSRSQHPPQISKTSKQGRTSLPPFRCTGPRFPYSCDQSTEQNDSIESNSYGQRVRAHDPISLSQPRAQLVSAPRRHINPDSYTLALTRLGMEAKSASIERCNVHLLGRLQYGHSVSQMPCSVDALRRLSQAVRRHAATQHPLPSA